MRIEQIYEDWKDKRIIVVGNGNIKDKGALIDSYDIVIRFNLCVIEGYEKDVGIKTDVCCVGSFTIFDTFPEMKTDFDYVFSFYYKDDGRPMKYNYYLPEQFYWDDMVSILKCQKPTTGFRLLYHLMKNNVNVDVIGFDFYQSNKHYYYEEIKRERYQFYKNLGFDLDLSKAHNYKNEQLFWLENKYHNFMEF